MGDKARAIIADYHDDPNQRWHSRTCRVDDRGFIFDQHKNWESGKCLDKSEDAPNGIYHEPGRDFLPF
ncbi:hypothetical protein Q5425_37020 [Amycolatopsis sp. A133]|uniref:RICIN domain-containing protein n=1 Tax=Amycolatopsis sp. A133 TaxID=3064472 RepID=UPI0027E6E883|nr:hypothetical protein [Amycolatopsis sp. A133]MDQ7809360.1 hypothetical protein [Amycolatopsis sp. A133]